ncbi:hemerythrin domain-containing protein [Streptomyces pseudogriseolus]|uniref:hemerythrin domain-containing protein n=1 Tax=Streptomyces pseudogriseolus TaxID=36817 RepID=UPI0034726C6B
MTAPAVSISGLDADALGGDDSILMRQRRDHARLDAMMNRYLSEDLPPGEPDAVWSDIVQLVFSHAFAEETVLWPLLRHIAPDGEELTRRVEEEHQAINELIARIEHSPGDPRRAEWIRQAFTLIRQDIRDEEDELLPRLRTAFGDRRLRRVGSAWEAVRATAPSRPHPGVPRRPPGNAVRGVPLSAFDRLRDLAPVGGPATRRAASPQRVRSRPPARSPWPYAQPAGPAETASGLTGAASGLAETVTGPAETATGPAETTTGPAETASGLAATAGTSAAATTSRSAVRWRRVPGGSRRTRRRAAG